MAGKPQLPPNFKDTVEDTRDLVNRLVGRLALVAGNAGNKWIDGFTKQDVSDVVDDLNAKVKDQVLDAWGTAEANVKPPNSGGQLMGGTPKPPDPPDVIATRYAQAAQKAVTDIAQVAIDVFDKVNADPTTNPPKYKPKDAIASLAQLAGAVMSGGLRCSGRVAGAMGPANPAGRRQCRLDGRPRTERIACRRCRRGQEGRAQTGQETATGVGGCGDRADQHRGVTRR